MTQTSDDFIYELITKKQYRCIKNMMNDDQIYAFLVDQVTALNKQETAIITLVGGVASGKTTLAREIARRLSSADTITTDAFATGTREYRHTQYGNVENKYDLELFDQKIQALKKLNEGEMIKFPHYDEQTGIAAAAGEENFPKVVHKVDYFIIEGDFNFCHGTEDLSIYFHVPDSVRIKNRIRRDMEKRGWSDPQQLEHDIQIREQKQHFPFTLPNAAKADILIVVNEKDDSYRYDVYTQQTSNTVSKKMN